MNDMRDVILNQAEQITRSLDVNKDVRVNASCDSIILTGMGGSGHPGDLLNALGLPTVPLYVHRNYDLPLDYIRHMGFKAPLVVASSYSGNTEETLTAYEMARSENLPILASAAGGKIEAWSLRDEMPFCKIDFPGMQPRHTLFAAFTGIATALMNSNLADDIVEELKRVADIVNKQTPGLEDKGKSLAEAIKGKVPVYTSTDNLGFATKNFKIQTNENAKHPGFWNVFPELNHNEMVGFSKLQEMDTPNKFFVLMLHDPEDHPRSTTRMQVTKQLYEQWGVTVEEFTPEGDTRLERLFITITLGLWTTYYLAKAYNIDPVPVDGVEDFKAKLAELAGEV